MVAYLLVSCAVLTSWSVQMLEFALMKEQEPVSGCLFAFDLRNSYFLVCSDARVAVNYLLASGNRCRRLLHWEGEEAK